MIRVLVALLALLPFVTMPNGASASTLERVQEDGVVRCGVRELGPALSYIDEQGKWGGFYPDICRGIAAAVIGDEEGVEFVVTGSDDRFNDLKEDRYDVLVESTTWTLSRDTNGLTYMPLYLFDGQGFLYFKPSGIKTMADLNNKRICVEGHTTSEINLIDHNRTNTTNWDIRKFSTMEGTFSAFFDHQCDAISTDVLVLASFRQALAPDPGQYAFVPERLSKEPLSAVVRDDDAQWADVIRWIVNALINAEELGVTSKNLVEMSNSKSPEINRLLGSEGDLGKKLGLDPRWAERLIRSTGNYGELFERTLGKHLKLERGINDLWTKGGLIWSPPMH